MRTDNLRACPRADPPMRDLIGGRSMGADWPLYRRVAAAILGNALDGLLAERPEYCRGDPEWKRVNRRDWERARSSAVTWLAERDATKWFEACGYDQAESLSKCGWADVARQVLREAYDGEVELDPGVVGHLRRTLKVLGERTE